MKKFILTFFAFWPVFLIGLGLTFVLVEDFDITERFFLFWNVAVFLFAAGWVAFIWDVWHNDRVPREKRALWTALLVFAAPYVQPFYYWFYIR